LKNSFFSMARRSGFTSVVRLIYKRRLLVLCYHGIVSDENPQDAYRLRGSVATGEFREQLKILKSLFQPVSAADLLDVIHGKGTLPPFPVLVTFDDGFRNNLSLAAPELEQQGVPALFHVTTGLVGSPYPPWPQELDERIRGWPRPTLPVPEPGGQDLPLPEDPFGRTVLAGLIRSLCKRLPDDQRRAYLDRLRDEPFPAGDQWFRETYEMLTWDEVRTLDRRGFAIGSHTVDHSILSRLTNGSLEHELTASKLKLESELGKECPYIAYPNGQTDDVSREAVSGVDKAGYKLGFTLKGKLNAPIPEPLEIDRICIDRRITRDIFHIRISGLYSFLTRLRP
jgi:peptidoglycan/xylan/chitin deacetylase (PgdA/CDA1 family)